VNLPISSEWRHVLRECSTCLKFNGPISVTMVTRHLVFSFPETMSFPRNVQRAIRKRMYFVTFTSQNNFNYVYTDNQIGTSVVFSFQLFVLLEIFNMKSVLRQQIKAGFIQQKSVILRGSIHHDHALMTAPSYSLDRCNMCMAWASGSQLFCSTTF